MTQYKIPQNVQREDRIIGPLTLKQLITLMIGGGITYAIYISLANHYFIEVWIVPVAITGILTLLFTFITIHNMPFSQFITYFIKYHLTPKKMVWIQGSDQPIVYSVFKEEKKVKKEIKETKEKRKSIKELSKILDTQTDDLEKKEVLEEIQSEKEDKKRNLQNLISNKK